MEQWNDHHPDPLVLQFDALADGETMTTDIEGLSRLMDLRKGRVQWLQFREGEFILRRVASKRAPRKASLEDKILALVGRMGQVTESIVVNRLRSFKADEVKAALHRLVATYRLDARRGAHKFNKCVFVTYSMPQERASDGL